MRILLDRFGGARSSLAHLAHLPIDGLKLDGSLLGSLAAPHGESAIAEAIVGLAHTLGLSIVVPGIETEQQLAVVRSLHVDAAQGHLIARPAPATSLADLEDFELDLGACGGGSAGGDAPDELLPLSAVADALGVSPSTVRRLADQGVLPGTRTGGGHRRFRRSDVQRLARERHRTPSLRPWELAQQPLPASAELLEHSGQTLVERAARALLRAAAARMVRRPAGAGAGAHVARRARPCADGRPAARRARRDRRLRRRGDARRRLRGRGRALPRPVRRRRLARAAARAHGRRGGACDAARS